MKRLPTALCWRIYTARMRLIGRLARIRAQLGRSDVISALREIQAAGGRSDDEQINRVLDVEALVSAARPRSIVELGSGLTSVVFAAYASRSDADYVCLEEDPAWAETTRRALGAAGIDKAAIRIEPVRAGPQIQC
jgi:predicted O-methyltransferase YrrM